MVSVEDTITGLFDVATSETGFFFPNPGVEKDECDGVLCTTAGDMGTQCKAERRENAYLGVSELLKVLDSRAWSPLGT